MVCQRVSRWTLYMFQQISCHFSVVTWGWTWHIFSSCQLLKSRSNLSKHYGFEYIDPFFVSKINGRFGLLHAAKLISFFKLLCTYTRKQSIWSDRLREKKLWRHYEIFEKRATIDNKHRMKRKYTYKKRGKAWDSVHEQINIKVYVPTLPVGIHVCTS